MTGDGQTTLGEYDDDGDDADLDAVRADIDRLRDMMNHLVETQQNLADVVEDVVDERDEDGPGVSTDDDPRGFQ